MAGDITHPQAFSLFTVSRRANSWLYAYYMMKDSKYLDSEVKYHLIKKIMNHLNYLNDSIADAIYNRGRLSNKKFWYQKSNGPLIAASRQAATLIMFPDFINRDEMLANALEIIQHYLKNNVTDEGLQSERDIAYHEGTFIYIAELFLLADINKITIPLTIKEQFEKTFEVLLRIIQPNGYLPAVGNAYIASSPSNFLALGSYIFKRSDYKYFAAPKFSTPDIDFMSYAFLYKYLVDKTVPKKRPYLRSDALPSTGFYIMRSGYGGAVGQTTIGQNPYDERLYLFFDLAPALGHTHYDALNIIISGYGSKPPYNLLDESGISHNWAINPLTQYYFGPMAHNILVVDDSLPPAWEGDPPPRCKKWFSNTFIDFVSGTYGKQYKGNDIIRDILFVKGEYWILRDEIRGNGMHNLKQVFNCSPLFTKNNEIETKYPVIMNGKDKSIKTDYDGPNMLILSSNPNKVGMHLTDGWKWYHGWEASDEPLNRFHDIKSPTVYYEMNVNTSTPIIFETILFPLHKSEVRNVSVERLNIVGEDTTVGENTGLKIIIGESNLKDRQKEKQGAKIDFYLTNTTFSKLNYGKKIEFNGKYALIRTVNGSSPFLIFMLSGKELQFFNYRISSTNNTDFCLKQKQENIYTIETSSSINITLPILDRPFKIRYHIDDFWTYPEFSVDDKNSVNFNLPSSGIYEVQILYLDTQSKGG